MKTLAKIQLELIRVEFMPEEMEFGKLYYSEKYNVQNHLCVCGCGQQTPFPIKEGEWSITESEKGFSITPSILQLGGCKSHYIITNSVANIV